MRAGEKSVGLRQSFELTRRDVVPLDDGARFEDFLKRGDNHVLPQIHSERGGLHDEDVLVFIHDQATEQIALGVDDAEGSRRRHIALAHRERGPDAFLEELRVQFHAVVREHADVDLRFGIVETGAEKTLTMILHLHQVAVVGRRGEALDGAVVNPRMAGENPVSFAGANNNGGQYFHSGL